MAESDGFEFIFNPEDSIYHIKDGMLKLYVGNISECPIGKWVPFDCVWDRASLIAIPRFAQKSSENFNKTLRSQVKCINPNKIIVPIF